MTTNITDITKEKIYAGILGKIIGVYAGRPFENWLWERIEETYGEINRYVNIEAGEDLIVADDDVTGTSMFVKSLLDHNFRADFSAKHIGQSWLDILIENKTVFWWGGYNMSTEHTAYLNLKKGIEAPASGSIAVNGKITAEQIGAQIFVDYWGLINPNNPDKTVAMARESASVGHDGEAVYGALIIAALVSMSFAEEDMDVLLDRAVTYVPVDSDIYRVIAFVRQCYAKNSTDWRWAFTQLRENFGYDKFGGWCHMVPNHGLVILALLYGGKSFHKSMVIVNTLGWDTDCNAANVGCINAVRLGLDSLTAGYDWRSPVADRLYLPTAHSTDNVTDAVREANYLVSLANKIAYNQEVIRDKRFSFNYRGSVQGFEIEAIDSYDKRAVLTNERGEYLAVEFNHLIKDMPVKLKTLTNTCETDEVRRYPYHLLGSPTLFSGQEVNVEVSCDINGESLVIEPFIVMFDHDLVRAEQALSRFTLINKVKQEITFTIPQVNHQQIAYIGFNILNEDEGDGKSGVVKLHHIDWSNTPSIKMTFPASNVSQWLSHWWVNSFISTMTQELFQGDIYLVNDCENEKRVFVYGSDDFTDYRANIVATPQSNKIWSVLFNYRGLKRHMEARFNPETESLSLIANWFDKEIVLATTDFKFEVRDWYDIQILSAGNQITLSVNGHQLISVESDIPAELGLDRGCIGVSTHFGSLRLRSIETQPAN